jgi:hypothetical protein
VHRDDGASCDLVGRRIHAYATGSTKLVVQADEDGRVGVATHEARFGRSGRPFSLLATAVHAEGAE